MVELPIKVYFHSLEAFERPCNSPISPIGRELKNPPMLGSVNDIFILADNKTVGSGSGSITSSITGSGIGACIIPSVLR